MRWLLGFSFFLLSAPCTAQVRTVVEPVEPNAVEAEVFFLNEGDEPLRFEPPATVDATRRGSDETIRLHASTRSALTLPAKGFAKLVYAQVVSGSPAAAAGPPPESASTGPGEASGSASAGFLDHLERHDPMYVIYGDGADSLKLQLSFAVRLYEDDEGRKLRFGYTQAMLWAIEAISGPIRATTYSPQLSFTHPVRLGTQPVDLTAGVIHDSTGRAGRESRDVNRIYVRAGTHLALAERWSLRVAPSAYVYFHSTGLGADDIDDYWGNGSVELALEQQEGLKLSALLRGSLRTGKGAAEFNASFPLRKIWAPLPKLYLLGQVFTGYGESLLDYRHQRTRLRFGIAFVR